MKHSYEWSVSKELAKQNRRLASALMIVIALWIMTIAMWVLTNNEAIESANTHEVQEICKDSLQTNGMNSSETVISQIPSLM